MSFPRASGILLHPTSLPGDFGIGDIGPSAFRFVDFLAEAKQTYWQMLPLGPTGFGDSPYQCLSTFAGNTLLISPEVLAEEGLLDQTDLRSAPRFQKRRINFGKVIPFKNDLLRKAFERFRQFGDHALFDTFCHFNVFWLEDYALFRALKLSRGQRSWQEWEEPLKLRDSAALARARHDLASEIYAQKFHQFLFYKQWDALKSYAREKGVRVIGDVPIFVALDSCDVWRDQAQFKLNTDGSPAVVAGVPPDYFSKTGQLWGNPIYNWDAMLADGFTWWIKRIAFALKMFDIVRIDHFRGFISCWETPGGDKTAERGQWVDVPGRELLGALKNAFGEPPFIAEDLGAISPEVTQLRDDFGLPGMKILQYAFGGDARNEFLPHNYAKNYFVYTGTHDNDTTAGWFKAISKKAAGRDAEHVEKEKNFCLKYLNTDGREIHWDMIRAAMASVADAAIIPMQDVLGLDTRSRMNLPATTGANWLWRCVEKDVNSRYAKRLAGLGELYGRNIS
jgi:4-alpha-glucanotransferase